MARVYLLPTVLLLAGLANAQHGGMAGMAKPGVAPSGNMTDPCYADPSAASCKAFRRMRHDWTADLSSLCSAMPFMTACILWAECRPLLDAKEPATNTSMAFGTYCGMISLVGDVCVEMPKMKGCEAYKALCGPTSVVEACVEPGPLPDMIPEEGIDMGPAGMNNTAPLCTYNVKQAVDDICASSPDLADVCTECSSEGRVFGDACPHPLNTLSKLCAESPSTPECDAFNAFCDRAEPQQLWPQICAGNFTIPELKPVYASVNMTDPCYANPAAASCAAFRRTHTEWSSDLASLCNSMPFMVGCSMWRDCQPLQEQKDPATNNSMAFGTYCGMPSLVGAACAEMPKMKGCEAYLALCAAPGSVVAACNKPGVPPSVLRTYDTKADVDAICASPDANSDACAACDSEGNVFGIKCPDPLAALVELCDVTPAPVQCANLTAMCSTPEEAAQGERGARAGMAAPAGQGGPAGGAFPAFPYPPYDIQQRFMATLYSALEQGGVGLFESPTGTGKTLSLICSSLQWLTDQRRREAVQAAARPGAAEPAAAAAAVEPGGEAGGSDDEAPDWMLDFAAQQERDRQRQLQERQRARIARAKAQLQRGGGGLGGGSRRRRGGSARAAATAAADDPEAEFLVEDWVSEGEQGGGSRKRSPGAAGLGGGGSSSGSGGSDGEGLGEEEELELPRKRQIIFASRTHSQLSQFVGELHRTPFADELSLVALGSRKALCINEAVLRLQSAPLINERCLDLQKPGSGGGSGGTKAAAVAGGDAVGPQRKAAKAGAGASGRCPYLASGSQAAATTRDMILAHPMDIEELAKLGRRKSVCPYYSARRAVPQADIILAPYSCLLAKETRESLGLRLEGNVLIIDEGHNLVEAINSSHSAELTAAAAAAAHRQLSAYFSRFQSRLAPGNCRHIQTLLRVAQVLSQAASGATQLVQPGSATAAAASGGACGGVLGVNDFLLRTGLDNLNLFKLVSYVRESKVVYKVAGFCQAQQKQEAAAAADASAAAAAAGSAGGAPAAAEGGGTGALHALVSILQALTNADADGRIVVQPPAAAGGSSAGQAAAGAAHDASGAAGGSGGGSAGGSLKFVLLNAAAHFGAVVSAAHAVVLASGTLSPLESVLHLFPGVPPHRLHRFACGHVVGQERLLALAVGSGPSRAALDFRHASRGTPTTIDELGRLVLNTCQVVPGGVVVFFPSFSYADQVHARWQQSGLLRQLGARKRVFREPRSAGEVEACLQEYAGCIAACSIDSTSSGGAGGGAGGGMPGGGSGTPGGARVGTLGGGAPGSAIKFAPGGGGGGGGGGKLSGAVMLCVVGGKLAEGINFGDALGRCVIMVGLPYPNPSDPELQERMRFMDSLAAAGTAGTAAAGTAAQAAGAASAAGTADAAGTAAGSAATGGAAQRAPAAQEQQQRQRQLSSSAQGGREYYSNLCMKAVNQCVGRVIRHRGDWAAVLLVDARYTSADARGPLAKLPGWIQQSLQVPRGFGDAQGRLARFARGMAAAEAAPPS
ncbi:putative ATP-dependent RNA helicase DDX11 [Micractinium conductrix]|uniref:ATP-dependent RNA helicase DDX11 n=1 Tax=Micractinium conductrix TaxID=554055 RepID=A0A2P6V7B6_9CHLO|nr:putative ATP-dependent RNA helicase DDX11 [Micractinium conductrix]|eukprot:PSC69979.1 putative ATP-dependent RNA helicase DDX11 [Micractinium conductrix]